MTAGDPPAGLLVRLAAGGLVRDGRRLLAGGVPFRLIRLNDAGAAIAAPWIMGGGPIGEAPGARTLARRLLDGGLLDAVPTPIAGDAWRANVSVVVPVRDRPAILDRCLAALRPCRVEVVVVDDGSRDHASVTAIAERHGARVIRHATSRGPGAARNTGLAATSTPLVAYVDSDVVTGPGDGWLRLLVAHFADPTVGAVAPRVHALDQTSAGLLAGYERRHASLDMGSAGGLIGPGRPLSYVPAATLVVRRAGVPKGGFDEALAFGEDVDFCWRMAKGGALVRYEPRAGVRHEHRLEPRAFLSRRRAYAASIGALARRHPGALPALRADLPMALAVALLLARRPLPAALVTLACAARVRRVVRGHTVRPVALAVELTSRGLLGTAHGVGHAIRRTWSPLLLLAAPRRPRVLLLLAAAYVLRATKAGAPRRPGDAAIAVVDDLVAAASTWEGSLRHRTAAPLLPAWSHARRSR